MRLTRFVPKSLREHNCQVSIASSQDFGISSPTLGVMPHSPFSGDPHHNGGRNIPILPSATRPVDSDLGEPMDVTTPASVTMGPPVNSSPEIEHGAGITNGVFGESQTHNGPAGNGVSAAAATASQQPKVVQTAFIHKLYK